MPHRPRQYKNMTDLHDSPTTGQSLTLYLPGILGPATSTGADAVPCRILETLLARAERTEHAYPLTPEDDLFILFDVHREGGADLPVAAVTRMLDMGIIDNDWWLRADPVHLGLDRDRLVLADASQLNITPNETSRLVAEIMEVYAADGWLLKAPHPERWYLKPARIPEMTTTPLSQVVGKDVRAFLPQGTDGKRWHTVMNEVQILLHASAVNSEREQQGKLPINSLWFWGGGRLPRIKTPPWARVWSEEPVSLSLARLSATATENVPEGFDAWRRRANEPGEHLVVLAETRDASVHADVARWREAMNRLEQNWMVPLLQALKAGKLSKAVLVTDIGLRFALDARRTRRWWRRRQPLHQYRPHASPT